PVWGYDNNAVPPPSTGLFAPPTIDLSNSSLEEFKQPEFEGYGVKINKSVSENSSNVIKKTFTVLTKSGLVSISTARQSSSRTATTVSTVRPIKTAAPKPFVNVAKTRSNAFQKVTSAVGKQGIDDVKSKACWIWRPKIKVLDHISKNNESYICKQFDYVDPTGLEFKVLVVYHTTNGHQFTMSNRQERIGYSRANENCILKESKHLGISKEVGKLRYLSLVVPLTKVGDEAVHKELGDRMERALTTTSSLEVEQDSEDQLKSTTKRRKAKVVISHEEENLVLEDPSKQGRMLKTKYEYVDTEHAEEESFEVHLDVLKRLSEATPGEPTEDMEKALWVELKRLFKLDKDDVLWKLQRYIYCQLQL
ncbi:hypothetical protein Tco_0664322, partial [Tanacetum coccineum]